MKFKGGDEEALSPSTKHLGCDKSISVFNRVEKLFACVEIVISMDEEAENTVLAQRNCQSGNKWTPTQSLRRLIRNIYGAINIETIIVVLTEL